ncbi:MAG: PHP domain-containing protein [Bacteroidales bacterium]|nr:PHP domain-containing protein [Bacteroidales bacterium]
MGCCCKNNKKSMEVVDVNAHLHTPYSFSAFSGVVDALDRASAEGVKVVGINDFYSMDGYAEWVSEARNRKLYPLLGIEFISLNSEDQAAGLRVNDPGNPGRTYLSGKGMAYPVKLSGEPARQLEEVRGEANRQVAQMCGKVCGLFKSLGYDVDFDFEKIKATLTKGSVRERHLAKAIRLAVADLFSSESDQIAFYEKLFGGKALKSDIKDDAKVENEIRGNLLKASGAAFVPEDPKAFLPMATVRNIILAAGGIPTYPFLADDAKGGFTDFEGDLQKAASTLKERGFHSVEFITTRNSVEVLEQYSNYLWDNGFVVTFGSEHNTPAMEPIKLAARGGVDLTPRLKELNYYGACIVAAHQYLVAEGKQGWLDADGTPDLSRRDEFIALGDKLIKEQI